MRILAIAAILAMLGFISAQTSNSPGATGTAKTPQEDAGCAGATPDRPCVIRPVAIFQPDPEYSPVARRKKIEGTVLLSVLVTTDGSPQEIEVVQSIGSGLDEEAVKALQKWRFKPGTRDGVPVALRIRVEMEFHLLK